MRSALPSKFLASTDVHGQFAGIPIVVQVANAVNKTRAMRSVMESVAGVDKDAWLPSLATKKFRSGTPKAKATVVNDGAKTPGKVAIFATCYINYNEPGIGLDLLKILDHNDVPYVIVEKEKCCGMPKLELGDLDAVNASKEANIPVLAKYAKDGYAILAAVPSCALMFKQEIPLMYPDEADVQLVKEHMWDPFEYLMQRKRDGLLKTEFPVPLGNVSYQIPCHGRVQNIGKKTEEMLKMIPGHDDQHHRALLRPRGHLWREEGLPPAGHEDRQARVQGHGHHEGRRQARLHQLRLPAGRPPHRAGLRSQRPGRARAEPSADAGAQGLRIELKRDSPVPH